MTKPKQKIAFIGTSYIVLCEPGYEDKTFESEQNNQGGVNVRFSNKMNLVRALSERYPEYTLYNCSEGGHGPDLYAKKVYELMERYNPDVFVIEITDGERYTLHFNDEYHYDWEKHFPIQIWEGGLPLNKDEPYREFDKPILDTGHGFLSANELNGLWDEKGVLANFSETEWVAFQRLISQLENGIHSRHSDNMALYKLIDHYLKTHNKEVHWFRWHADSHTVPIPYNFQMLRDDTPMIEWEYYRKFGNQPHRQQLISLGEKYEDHFNTFCYDHGTHLKAKHMADFSQYFDPIFTNE